MLLAHYYALVTIAVLATGAWLFIPHARTGVTTLAAFLSWGLAALSGNDVETYQAAGDVLNDSGNNTVALSQGDQLVTVPVPDEFRLLMTLFALLSILALLLYAWGVYPPKNDAQPEDQL